MKGTLTLLVLIASFAVVGCGDHTAHSESDGLPEDHDIRSYGLVAVEDSSTVIHLMDASLGLELDPPQNSNLEPVPGAVILPNASKDPGYDNSAAIGFIQTFKVADTNVEQVRDSESLVYPVDSLHEGRLVRIR